MGRGERSRTGGGGGGGQKPPREMVVGKGVLCFSSEALHNALQAAVFHLVPPHTAMKRFCSSHLVIGEEYF